MTTIAEDLLADFEDSGSEQGDHGQENDGFRLNDAVEVNGADGLTEMYGDEEDGDQDGIESTLPGDLKADNQEDEEETKARIERMQLGGVSDVGSVATLWKQLEPVIEKIQHYQNLPHDQQTKNVGSIEDNPEYNLLTQSNTLSTNIDSEIILVHKFIRDHYSVRFPELETLIQNPQQYAKAVAIIGNGPMEDVRAISESKDNIVGQSLRQVLDGPSLMVVTVEATNTRGEPLSEHELQHVRDACSMTLKLDKAKDTLTDYVESRMSLFAPNLTVLIGSRTAAQLLNYTGGITGLAKTPACNIPPLGSKKTSGATGLATNIGIRHQGFLYANEIVREVPPDFKVQAMRILSAKIVLAARVDQAHQSPHGEQGIEFYDQVQKRIGKLSEVPANKGIKALPAPDDKPARKRGGRRARKAKEATAMTDLRKAQNRMVFGKEEKEVGFGDSSTGLGMVGQTDDGRIRRQEVDQRTRAKLSKKNQGWGGTATSVGGTSTSLRSFGGGVGLGTASSLRNAGLRSSGVGGMRSSIGNQAGGTTSTIAFTPVQGLELVDPKVRAEMERKEKVDQDRWFKGGTFTQVGGAGAAPAKRDAQGFAMPSLPASKRQKGND